MAAAGRPTLASATAVILAGGLGTRLAPVVSDRQKVLAAVAGRPFLGHVLDQLATAGLERAVLCTGHLGHQVTEAFGDRHGRLALVYSHESTPAGTGGALRLAWGLLGSGPVLVLNGDSLCRADLADLWAFHHARRATATIVLARVADGSRFGRVQVDAAGAVSVFEEKRDACGPCWVSAGVYVLAPQVLDTIPPARPVSLEREVLPAWVGRGLVGFGSGGTFLDIGTPEAYAGAGLWLAERGLSA